MVTLPHPIQISSPGSCLELSTRSTVLVLSAMKYCVSASMTLQAVRLLPDLVKCHQPDHCSLGSSPPCCQLTEGSERGIGRRDFGRGDLGLDLEVPSWLIVFRGRRRGREACVSVDRSIGLVVSASRFVSLVAPCVTNSSYSSKIRGPIRYILV